MTPTSDTLARMGRHSIIAITGHTAGRPGSSSRRASGRRSDWFTGDDGETRCREAIQQAERLGLLFRGIKLARARELWQEGISQGYEPGPDFLRKASSLGLCADPEGMVTRRSGVTDFLGALGEPKVVRARGGGASGVDPADRGLPTVPVNWDELADFVEAGNPGGHDVAEGFRLRAAEDRAAAERTAGSDSYSGASPSGASGPAAGGDTSSGAGGGGSEA